MEVKIINIQRCKKGNSVRNTERHVGIIEKSISHDNYISNITFEEKDCIIAGQLSGLILSFGYQCVVPMTWALLEGDFGGYPTPQYHKKNWQIPKYRVENGWNTNTAFMTGDAYLMLYPSRVFFLSQACIHQKSTSTFARRHEIWNKLIGTTIEKLGHCMSYQFYHRVTVRNCVFI